MSITTLSKAKMEILLKFVCEKHGIDIEKENERFSHLSNIPLPFDGIKRNGCCALKLNHGLYTQCCDKTVDEGEFCKTCERGEARYGKVEDRISNTTFPFIDPRGKKEVRYGNVMEKLGISREDAMLAASQRGMTIMEENFEITKTTRGRPKKKSTEDVSSSDEEKPKKKRGRPRKENKTVKHNDVSAMVNVLIEEKKQEVNTELTESVADIGGVEKCDENGLVATMHEHIHGENADKVPIAWKELEQTAEEPFSNIDKEYLKIKEENVTEIKNEKVNEKAAKKAAKEAEKEAEKAAKKAAKEDEKAAKKAAKKATKEAEKAAKKAEKEAEKAAKKAEKEVEKADKKEKTPEINIMTSVQNDELKEESMSPYDSGEEEDVSHFQFNGVVYLRSMSNTLYDATTHEEVGNYIPGENGEEGKIVESTN